MAISRVPGYSLLSDLDRQGVDLQFTTSSTTLAYLDFANFYFGVNTDSPTQALDVNGNVLVSNGHIYTSGNVTYDIGSVNNWFNTVYANTVTSNQIIGTLQTNAQPNITSVGNLISLAVTGNLIAGNIQAGNFTGSLLSNIIITGDADGIGPSSNIVLTLVDTGVTAGIYGSADNEYADQIPRITVDSKGRITNIANIALTQIGNVTFTDTTISTTSNLTIAPANQFIFAGNSIISNVANPLDFHDVVTVDYLNTSMYASNNRITLGDSSVTVIDTGANSRIEITVDGELTGNINSTTTNLYHTVNIANISITTDTITSTSGNIILNALGSGTVQIIGSDAFGMPYGDINARPANPVTGYVRYNTEISSIEVWSGIAWDAFNQPIESQSIEPDGTTSTYLLIASSTSSGVMVNINGTVQQPDIAYSVTGNIIVFSEPPLTTDIIEIRILTSGTARIIPTSLEYGNISVILDSSNINVTGNLIVSNSAIINGIVYANSNFNSTSTTTGALVVSGGIGISGNINSGNLTTGSLTVQQTITKFTSPAISANEVTLNYNNGAIFNISSNSANIKANFTNIPGTPEQFIPTTLIITQGSTAYIPNLVTINGGGNITPKWQGGILPFGTANQIDIVSFTFICTSNNTWTVLGTLTDYN